jgi:predicted DNA-binding protein (MmcQ/YjbR family)
MNTQQLQQCCRAFAQASETLHAHPGNILVYAVGGKKFAYFKTSEPEKGRFSLRVEPDLFLGLTAMPGVKPARYMGRFHWVTIVDVCSFPPALLSELLAWSYQKARSALSQAERRALDGEAA